MRKLPAKLSSQAVPCHMCDWLPQKIMPLCLHSCCQLHYCLYPYHVCWISFKHITYTLLNAINWSNIFFHLGSSWLNYSYPSVTPVRMKLSCLFWLNCIYIYINSPIWKYLQFGPLWGWFLGSPSFEGATWGDDQIHPDELVFYGALQKNPTLFDHQIFGSQSHRNTIIYHNKSHD